MRRLAADLSFDRPPFSFCLAEKRGNFFTQIIMLISGILISMYICNWHAFLRFIIYMAKLLQSDWLRGVQLFH